MKELGPAIYHILTAVTAITDLVGDKIFWIHDVPINVGLPAIQLRRSSGTAEMTNDGEINWFKSDIEVQIVSANETSYATANDIADAIHTALHGYQGTVHDIDINYIVFDSGPIDDYISIEGKSKGICQITLNYTVCYSIR